VALEQRGVPTVTVVTEAFTTLYAMEARALGMADLPAVVIPHPIVSRSPEEMRAQADAVLDALVALLAQPVAQAAEGR
jgi:hypothetical protein